MHAEVARKQWVCYRCRAPLPVAGCGDAFRAHKYVCPKMLAPRPCRKCGQPMAPGMAMNCKYHVQCAPTPRTRDGLGPIRPTLAVIKEPRPCRGCGELMPPELPFPIKYHPACSPWRAQMQRWAHTDREEERSWQKAKTAMVRVTAYLADTFRAASR